MRALVGEYDNYEQIAVERRALSEGRRVAPPHQRVHTLIERVDAPQVGQYVLFLEQYLNDDPSQVLRRQVHRFVDHPQRGAVKHLVFDFVEPQQYTADRRSAAAFASLRLDELIPRPGCEVFWRDVADYLHGTTETGRCRRRAPDGRELVVSQDLRLYEAALWILDRAVDVQGRPVYGPPDDVHQKSRRVRHYRGWAGVRQRADRGGASTPWRLQRDLTLHNEGGSAPLIDESGQQTGYSLRLERLGPEAAAFAMLRLSLVEDQGSRVVGYAWSAEDADVVGFNLGWAQAEMRRAD